MFPYVLLLHQKVKSLEGIDYILFSFVSPSPTTKIVLCSQQVLIKFWSNKNKQVYLKRNFAKGNLFTQSSGSSGGNFWLTCNRHMGELVGIECLQAHHVACTWQPIPSVEQPSQGARQYLTFISLSLFLLPCSLLQLTF